MEPERIPLMILLNFSLMPLAKRFNRLTVEKRSVNQFEMDVFHDPFVLFAVLIRYGNAALNSLFRA